MDGIKLLIIDRHEIAALGLLYLIMKNFPQIAMVRHANSEQAAMGMISEEHWHIVVIDADTAGARLGGIVGELSARCPSSAVMVKYNTTSASAPSHATGIASGESIYMDYSSDRVCAMLKRCIDTLPSRCEGCGNEPSCSIQPKSEPQPIVLSPREQVVLGCIARGMTTKEIANELFVSINTVNTHRQHLLDKFGARNVVDLVIRAIANGLVVV